MEAHEFRRHLLREWGANNAILLHDVVKAAVDACENSVVPKSRYQKGVAIFCEDGSLYAASRIEVGNHTVVPELAALAAMFARNPTLVRLIAAVGCVQGRDPALLLPDPICRELMVKFSHNGRQSARLVLTTQDIGCMSRTDAGFRAAARFAEDADSKESPYGLVPFNALPLGQPTGGPAGPEDEGVVKNIFDYRRRRIPRKQ